MTEVNREVQLAVGEILGSTKHLVRQLDEVKTDFRDFRAEIRAEQQATNERLSKVEQFVWRATGIAVAASSTLPVIITIVGYWITS